MEWLEEPVLTTDNTENTNPNARGAILGTIGAGALACATSGLLCGSLCLIN